MVNGRDQFLGWMLRPALVLTVVAAASPARVAPAVEYSWTADGTSLGGSGTWNTTSSNWFVGSSSGSLGPCRSPHAGAARSRSRRATATTAAR